MPWVSMQVEILPEDRLARPLLGPTVPTRAEAHAQIQGILDDQPLLAEVAARWRRGAEDDVVFAGPFTWTLLQFDGDDPRPAALAWLEEWAEGIRSAGIDVQVAAPTTIERKDLAMTHTAQTERAGTLEARVLTFPHHLSRPGAGKAEVEVVKVGPDGDPLPEAAIWSAVTGVPVEANGSADPDAARDEAEELLRAEGWTLYGNWYDVDSGSAIEVARQPA